MSQVVRLLFLSLLSFLMRVFVVESGVLPMSCFLKLRLNFHLCYIAVQTKAPLVKNFTVIHHSPIVGQYDFKRTFTIRIQHKGKR